MVFGRIAVIRGVVVDRKELLEFILNDPALMSAEFGKMTRQEIIDLLENDEEAEKYWDDLGWKYEFIHTWPCCSPLSSHKFIIGVAVGEFKPKEVMDTIYTIEKFSEMRSDDAELRIIDRLDAVGITKSIQTIFMLDDCASCS